MHKSVRLSKFKHPSKWRKTFLGLSHQFFFRPKTFQAPSTLSQDYCPEKTELLCYFHCWPNPQQQHSVLHSASDDTPLPEQLHHS